MKNNQRKALRYMLLTTASALKVKNGSSGYPRRLEEKSGPSTRVLYPGRLALQLTGTTSINRRQITTQSFLFGFEQGEFVASRPAEDLPL